MSRYVELYFCIYLRLLIPLSQGPTVEQMVQVCIHISTNRGQCSPELAH